MSWRGSSGSKWLRRGRRWFRCCWAGSEARWTEMAGVAAEVEARAGKAPFREKLLVTHRGLSGPAVLQASSYWRPGEELVVDFAPHDSGLLDSLMEAGGRRDAAALRQALREVLPQRLANHLAEIGEPKVGRMQRSKRVSSGRTRGRFIPRYRGI